MPDYVLRIHRDTFPHTDHGYTWVECLWLEIDGKRAGAQVPCGGACARLMHLPGGPIPLPDMAFELRKVPAGEHYRTVKTEQDHPGFHRVGAVSIVPA